MRIRSKLSYANVTATIALFLVLGGGAYAAKKNLIETKDIANKAVTGKKVAKETIKSKNLKNGKAVAGLDVKDASLTGGDVTDGSLSGADILDAGVAAVDLAAGSVTAAKVADNTITEQKLVDEEQFHIVGGSGEPAFGNGVEGDCTWKSGDAVIPGLSPVGFRKNRFGELELTGVVASEEHAGVGDEECGATGPETDDLHEDSLVFVLPAGYRPEHASLHVGSSSVTIVVTGEDALALPGTGSVPAGGVYASFSGGTGSATLEGIRLPLADDGAFATAARSSVAEEASAAQVEQVLGR